MQMDFKLTKIFMQEGDFYEGVRCALVDKGQSPKWKYSDPMNVPDKEVNSYFSRMQTIRPLDLQNII